MSRHFPGPPPGSAHEPPEMSQDEPLERRLIDQFFRFARSEWMHVPAPGLTKGETGIMFIIHGSMMHGGKLRISDLSKRMRVSSPTVTQHINSLESRGLVKREQSPDDKREVHITLTDKGEETLQGHRDVMEANFREFIELLGGDAPAELMLAALKCASDFFNKKSQQYI